MKVFRALISIVAAVLLVACGVLFYRSCASGCGGGIMVVQADTVDSEVLADLQKDETFNASDYPENAEDYSLQVFQIAESADGSFFVYVYQPSGEKVTGTSINISTAINDNLKYVNYKLSLVSSAGTLYKYLVNDLAVKKDAVRYYDISNILRKWDETIDEKPADDNTIQEVPNTVGQLWTACTVNGSVTYERQYIETVLITDKHVGFIRYEGGFNLTYSACDSHYLAFSTDHNIERLMEAEVYFVTRERTRVTGLGGGTEYKDPVERYAELTYEQEVSNPSYGLFAHTYTWNRIESVVQFVSKEDLTDETKAALLGKEWVLRFYETQYFSQTYAGGASFIDTEVTDVTILRLKFEANGAVYDLGVVDSKSSGDMFPDNIVAPGCDDFFAYLWAMLTRIWRFVKKHWKWFLIGAIVIIVGSAVVAVIKWGFKDS